MHQNPLNNDCWVSVPYVADLLKVSRPRGYQLIEEGKIVAVKTNIGVLVYLPSVVKHQEQRKR